MALHLALQLSLVRINNVVPIVLCVSPKMSMTVPGLREVLGATTLMLI